MVLCCRADEQHPLFMDGRNRPPAEDEEGVIEFMDHSSDGVWSTFLVVDHVLDSLAKAFPPSLGKSMWLEKGRCAIDSMGLALAVPASVCALSQTCRKVVQLMQHASLGPKPPPSTDWVPPSSQASPCQEETLGLGSQGEPSLAHEVKETLLSVANLVYNIVNLPELLQCLRCLSLGVPQLRLLNVTYYVSALVLDGVDWVETRAREGEYMRKVRLTASVAISVLSLLGMMWALPLEGAGVLALTIFSLDLTWLVLKWAPHVGVSYRNLFHGKYI